MSNRLKQIGRSSIANFATSVWLHIWYFLDNLRNSLKQIGYALATFAVYTWLLNWKVALLLTIGIGFHEYSHILAAKMMGLKTKGFYLVPFMGGVALIEGRYRTYGQQAFVVLGGPIGGGLLATVTAVVYYITGYPILAAAAQWMFFLNLFNLLPMSLLDGGQIMNTITYSINHTFGVVMLTISTVAAVVVLWFWNPILAGLALVYGGFYAWSEIHSWFAKRDGRTWLMTEAQRNPPVSLSTGQLLVTSGSFMLTVVWLGRFYLSFRDNPDANFWALFKH